MGAGVRGWVEEVAAESNLIDFVCADEVNSRNRTGSARNPL